MRNLIKAGATLYRDSTILVTETWALRDGLLAVVEAECMKTIMEGDNITVIHALKGLMSTPWQTTTIVHDILGYLETLDHSIRHHTFWEANRVANWLSKSGHSLSVLYHGHHHLPQPLVLFCMLI